ncbi:BrnA antitoxin family protein [Mesorhizobium sp. M0938]|uniref:BrnA antitoxin family protein n=1 Tax=unclassified Mesorhizobium TaxID=325217 RepID=UPI00333C951E
MTNTHGRHTLTDAEEAAAQRHKREDEAPGEFQGKKFMTYAEVVRRGRPRTEKPKVRTSIYLSQEVIDKFKATGPGWQTRIDEVLKGTRL